MAFALAAAPLGFAPAQPAVRPVGRLAVRSAAPVMQSEDVLGIVSSGPGIYEAPKGLESELGAVGPLGFWDPLGLVRRRSQMTCLQLTS